MQGISYLRWEVVENLNIILSLTREGLSPLISLLEFIWIKNEISYSPGKAHKLKKQNLETRFCILHNKDF